MKTQIGVKSIQDPKIGELLDSLKFFHDWHVEAFNNKALHQYVTWQTDFDLRCLIHGVVGLVDCFTKRNPGHYVVLKRLTQVGTFYVDFLSS